VIGISISSGDMPSSSAPLTSRVGSDAELTWQRAEAIGRAAHVIVLVGVFETTHHTTSPDCSRSSFASLHESSALRAERTVLCTEAPDPLAKLIATGAERIAHDGDLA